MTAAGGWVGLSLIVACKHRQRERSSVTFNAAVSAVLCRDVTIENVTLSSMQLERLVDRYELRGIVAFWKQQTLSPDIHTPLRVAS